MDEWQRHISPYGIASYPHLHVPDDRFDKRNPIFSIKVVYDMSDSDVIAWLDEMQDLRKNWGEASEREGGKGIPIAASPFKVDDEEQTVTALFKLPSMTSKDAPQRPALHGTKENPLDRKAIIGGGSKVRVAYNMLPYYSPGDKGYGNGVHLRLDSVQVVTLVVGGKDCAFDDADSGDPFEAEAATPARTAGGY